MGHAPIIVLRGPPGTYERISYGSETFVLVPSPLPPNPPITWTAALSQAFDEAMLALGRLSAYRPAESPFDLATHLLKRDCLLGLACYQPHISYEDLFMHEAGHTPLNLDATSLRTAENTIAAYATGLRAVEGGQAPTVALLKNLHATLAAEPRHKQLGGGKKHLAVPGSFRQILLWQDMLNRRKRPNMRPRPRHVPAAMAALEAFMAGAAGAMPALLMIALVHAQFDIIYPFVEAGPRANLLLTALLLKSNALTANLPIQLSEAINADRPGYVRALDAVRTEGRWETWLEYFAQAVKNAASASLRLAEAIDRRYEDDKQALLRRPRGGETALVVLTAVQRQAVASLADVSAATGKAPSTVVRAVRVLQGLGIVHEVTGRPRNWRLYYEPLVATLSRGPARPVIGPCRKPKFVGP